MLTLLTAAALLAAPSANAQNLSLPAPAAGLGFSASAGLGIAGLGSPPSAGIGSVGLGSVGLGSPGLGSPGLGSPGLGSPGLGSPGLGSPGLDSPGLGSPGLGSAHPLSAFPLTPTLKTLRTVAPTSVPAVPFFAVRPASLGSTLPGAGVTAGAGGTEGGSLTEGAGSGHDRRTTGLDASALAAERGSPGALSIWKSALAAARRSTVAAVAKALSMRGKVEVSKVLASKDTKTITEYSGVPSRVQALDAPGKVWRHWVRREEDLRSILATGLLKAGPVSYVEFTGSSRAYIKDIYPDLRGVFFTATQNASAEPRVMNEETPHFVDFRLPEGVAALSLDGETVLMIPAEPGSMVPVELVGSSL